MRRWVRLIGDQYLGFWILGLVLFAVQEIPYLLMPILRLEANPIMNMTETSPVLDACEKFFGSLCITFTVLSILLFSFISIDRTIPGFRRFLRSLGLQSGEYVTICSRHSR